MPADNLVETAFEYNRAQRSALVNSHRFVICGSASCQLRMEPNLLLARRKRNLLAARPGNRRLKRSGRNLQFAAPQPFEKLLPGFQDCHRVRHPLLLDQLESRGLEFLAGHVEANGQAAQSPQAEILAPNEIFRG